uniref:MIP21014p n=1 Tax=Drosophila melanogaster TaxID=7227 RepID=D6W4U7_DROME|nr:MIP21014p [Drosophila melanogaster]
MQNCYKRRSSPCLASRDFWAATLLFDCFVSLSWPNYSYLLHVFQVHCQISARPQPSRKRRPQCEV